MEMDAAKRECELGNIKMSGDPDKNQLEDPPMHDRRITLADGRYMIFFTFGDEAPHENRIDDQGDDV